MCVEHFWQFQKLGSRHELCTDSASGWRAENVSLTELEMKSISSFSYFLDYVVNVEYQLLPIRPTCALPVFAHKSTLQQTFPNKLSSTFVAFVRGNFSDQYCAFLKTFFNVFFAQQVPKSSKLLGCMFAWIKRVDGFVSEKAEKLVKGQVDWC